MPHIHIYIYIYMSCVLFGVCATAFPIHGYSSIKTLFICSSFVRNNNKLRTLCLPKEDSNNKTFNTIIIIGIISLIVKSFFVLTKILKMGGCLAWSAFALKWAFIKHSLRHSLDPMEYLRISWHANLSPSIEGIHQ